VCSRLLAAVLAVYMCGRFQPQLFSFQPERALKGHPSNDQAECNGLSITGGTCSWSRSSASPLMIAPTRSIASGRMWSTGCPSLCLVGEGDFVPDAAKAGVLAHEIKPIVAQLGHDVGVGGVSGGEPPKRVFPVAEFGVGVREC
jgi:hypothetical protein